MISIKKMLKELKEKQNQLPPIARAMIDINDLPNYLYHNYSSLIFYVGKNKIEIESRYYESVYEYFDNASSIVVNGELLFDGYRESLDKEVYIKGKYKTSKEAIDVIKNMKGRITIVFKDYEVAMLRNRYPSGTKIKLINMNDEQAVPSGTEGIVDFVDDIGTIHMKWENGSSLGLVYGEDKFEIVKEKNIKRSDRNEKTI